jgi:hypothetical protein
MSLRLVQNTTPHGLYLKTWDAKRVIIGDYELSIEDFGAMVKYVLTNTDLVENDYRLELLRILQQMQVVDGWNDGSKRLGWLEREAAEKKP